ncbi:MAG: alkaline phosphatase family protein [Betaproteobacteria bacterium]
MGVSGAIWTTIGRTVGRWLRGERSAIVLACAIAMVAGAVSWRLATWGLEDVVGYRSPYAFPIDAGQATARMTRRLVLVIVDGLGFGAVDDMPVLKDIGSRGVAFSLQVNQPSFSYPGWTTLLTGAPPEISGVTTNAFSGPVPVDSLFDAARRAGLKAALVASEDWKALFGASVAKATYVATGSGDLAATSKADAEILDAALRELEEGDAEFVVAHFSSVDAAGHASGAASAAYKAASAEVDTMIGKMLASLDLTSDTIVVTSDHGHTARGGHGGWEKDVITVPLVAAGAGIVTPERPAPEISWAAARHEDVGPTCAALLGTSVPTHSQGRVLFEMLDAPPHAVAERAIRQAEARLAFTRRYLEALGEKAPVIEPVSGAALLHNDGKYGEATELALDIDAAAVQAMSSGRQRFLARQRFASVPAGVVVIAGFAWGLAALAGRGARNMRIPVIGAAVYFGAFYAIVLARGITLSMSVFNSESEVMPFFTWRMADSVVCALSASAVSGWLAWQARKRPVEALTTGLMCAYLVVFVLVLQVAVFVVIDGARFTRHLPDFRVAFKYYVDLLQTTVVGVSSPVLAGISICVWWLRRHAEAVQAGARKRGRHSMARG